MSGNRDRRVARLEEANAPKLLGVPLVIVTQVGETEEQAVLRIYGPAGLPQKRPANLPVIFVQPVRAPERDPVTGLPISPGEGA